MKDQVDILLATYQGGFYLKEQLQSMMQQSYPHFRIFIRDDGSTDQTLPIIKAFCQEYPERIFFLPSTQRLGVKGNFCELMNYAQAPYVMFCDQDDIWLPTKIEISLRKMKELEHQYGAELPLIVHTDLCPVKADLTMIAPSFWQYSNIDPSRTNLNALLVKNTVTGCTVIINQPLLRLAYPIPDQAVMHDWWLALVGAILGKLAYLKEPTILYRQHGKNDVGAKKFSLWLLIKDQLYRKREIVRRKKQHKAQKYQQAQHFLDRYAHLLDSSQQDILKAFASLGNVSPLRRLVRLWRYRFIPPIFSKWDL